MRAFIIVEVNHFFNLFPCHLRIPEQRHAVYPLDFQDAVHPLGYRIVRRIVIFGHTYTYMMSDQCVGIGIASMALNYGMPIESVNKILGHTDIKTTQIYAKVTNTKLDSDISAFENKVSGRFSL